MRYKGKEIGNISKNILSGKVTVPVLKDIMSLLNEIYSNCFHINLGLSFHHEKYEGYSFTCVTPQRWMGSYPTYCSNDKTGLYLWLKDCLYECRNDLSKSIQEQSSYASLSQTKLYYNQIDFIISWVDMAHIRSELSKYLEE